MLYFSFLFNQSLKYPSGCY